MEEGLFYQERFFSNDGVPDYGQETVAEFKHISDVFRRFIREFSIGGFQMIYREQLKKNYNLCKYQLDISLNHLRVFDEDAEKKLRTYPMKFMPALEEAAKIVADEVTKPRPEGQEQVQDIQVTLGLEEYSTTIRKVKSTQVSQIIKISGIIVASSQVRAKATKLTLQCRQCHHTIADIKIKSGFDGYALPRQCGAPQTGQMQRCPMDPYVILPDKCICVDYQTLKLQENPEDIPHGEMPRHLPLYVDRYLTDKVSPGCRVTILGVYSIRKTSMQKKNAEKSMSGIRVPYMKVLGIKVETNGAGRAESTEFTPEQERAFHDISKRADVYDLISKSIAPSIYGSADIKKSIACLLFGGSRKRMPDGITRRGDINLLLLGDPGTAKSQLLKFVEKVSPIGVYTSGKGSSAAGLTASIVRDPNTRGFIMEGGAMVLADGGVVCIDEFDKMREDDRVAIHEAMEQQTISIAKAGITTTLNSRCSVLAAANSVFGRWDDSRGSENIDFLPTILSRFDMIYIVKDAHDMSKDAILAKHVIEVHVHAANSQTDTLNLDGVAISDKMEVMDKDGYLTLDFLKKYVSFARQNCGPRLTDTASNKLVNHYIRMRNPTPEENTGQKLMKDKPSAIPITVRQLEAIIRISEALAKMELAPLASERHIDEALRLFRVSTMEAAATGNLSGIEGFTSDEDQEAISRIEKQLKKRFAVGTHVSEHLIVQDFVQRQHYRESLVKKVINALIRRGDLQQKMQRKMLYRVR